MAEAKKKNYVFERVFKCQACGTIAKVAGPCSKCGKLIFDAQYRAVEQK